MRIAQAASWLLSGSRGWTSVPCFGGESTVESGGAIDRARPKVGDLFVEVDGDPLVGTASRRPRIVDVLLRSRAVELTVLRGGETPTIEWKVERSPTVGFEPDPGGAIELARKPRRFGPFSASDLAPPLRTGCRRPRCGPAEATPHLWR